VAIPWLAAAWTATQIHPSRQETHGVDSCPPGYVRFAHPADDRARGGMTVRLLQDQICTDKSQNGDNLSPKPMPYRYPTILMRN
jgi:hypothetical protein